MGAMTRQFARSKSETEPAMTDAEFLAEFEACTLPREAWTHRAHVRMAWLYLGRHPLAEARRVVSEGIRHYNKVQIQKPLAYHETITQAFLTLIASRRDSGESFEAFCGRSEDLLDSKLSALLTHYRRETLFSYAARQAFLPPDLAEFPRISTPTCRQSEC
jgi:hypothetical protein